MKKNHNEFISKPINFPKYPMDKFVIVIVNKRKRLYYSNNRKAVYEKSFPWWTLDLNKAEIFDGNCYDMIKEKFEKLYFPADSLPRGYKFYGFS